VRRAITRVAAAVAVACVASIATAAAVGAASTPLVRVVHNAQLKASILVDRNGHTLYHLSVERKGHFICTNTACLSFWQPLVVGKNVKPTGTASLGTVLRPDGRLQVTYKGGPLYTFAGDAKRGDTKGEGFKDVGIWHAAALGGSTAPTAPAPSGGYGSYAP